MSLDSEAMMMGTAAEEILDPYLSSSRPAVVLGVVSRRRRANSLGSTGIQRDELVGAVKSMLVSGE